MRTSSASGRIDGVQLLTAALACVGLTLLVLALFGCAGQAF